MDPDAPKPYTAPPSTTEETYKKQVAEYGISTEIEPFEGYSLAWIGRKTAKKVILYSCGGGFLQHALDAHLVFLINSYQRMKANNQDVSIAILCYGTCPGTAWPNQVRQIVGAVQYLLKSRAPESINFSADSAGGTLTLAFFLHISHPHPSVSPIILPTSSRFGDVFIVSPGSPTPGPTNTTSFWQDPNPDILTARMCESGWAIIKDSAEKGIEMPNPWIDSSSAPEEWWSGIPVNEIKIVVGGLEIIRDDIAAWSVHLKKNHDRSVEVEVFPGEIHDQALIDTMMGVTEDKASTKYWKKWFQDFRS